MFSKSFILAAIAASAAAAPIVSLGGGAAARAGAGAVGATNGGQTFKAIGGGIGAGAGAGATVSRRSFGNAKRELKARCADHEAQAVAAVSQAPAAGAAAGTASTATQAVAGASGKAASLVSGAPPQAAGLLAGLPVGQALSVLPGVPQGFPVSLPTDVLSGLKEIEIDIDVEAFKAVFAQLEIDIHALSVDVEAKVNAGGISLFDVSGEVDKLFGLLGGVAGQVQALPKAASPCKVSVDLQVELAQIIGAVVAKVTGTVEKLEAVPGAAALLAGIDARLSAVLNVANGVVGTVLGLVGHVLATLGVAVSAVLYRAGGIVFGLLNGVTGNILSCGCN